MPPDYEALSAELIRLRNWRHDNAAPTLLALQSRQDVTEDLLRETAAIVEKMQRRDEIADGIAAGRRTSRRLLFTRTEKVLILVFATPPFVNLALRIANLG